MLGDIVTREGRENELSPRRHAGGNYQEKDLTGVVL